MQLGTCTGKTQCPPPSSRGIMLLFEPKNPPIRIKMAQPQLVLYLKLCARLPTQNSMLE